MSTEGTE